MKHLFILFLIRACMMKVDAQSSYPLDSMLFKHYGYREIGPFRGGRASGVCGDYTNKQVYYMAATGGGVWQTRDGGNNWKNISDGFFGGSIGCVEVCPTDPLLLFAGTGESTLRGNVSEGHGIWKSRDGGRTWKFSGLADSRHIMRMVFHPRNPDILYVAALGHLFGSNEERGVYRTLNGGKTWERVLYVDDRTGAVDIQLDPVNPDIMYASTWEVKRTPHSFESGGPGSALWKSTDGGEHWEKLNQRKGFPKDTLGIICMAICPSNPDKMYALVESKQGGLFVSGDAGETWTRQNEESKIRQRAWYFSRLAVDPKNDQLVYVCNVELHKSTDGGKSFHEISTPHGDHHGMWIDPQDGQRMIIADDGGAQISTDGGKTWSTYHNQPTAQFYRVTTDQHFPYRVLGCQQDNSSIRMLSRTYGRSIGAQDWSSTAGFESGHIAVDPLDDDIVYGGNYGGYLSRLNHKTGENRTVSVYPVSPIGDGADTLKYRFQWNFPIFFSPHNPRRLYAAGNHLFVTEDEGQHWKAISPDLTTNDKSRQAPSGGPITKDNTGVEYYCTIFAAAESPVKKDLIWCGSDDGLLHITRNGGLQWEDVTPPNMPEWMMINCIEPSPFEEAVCYVVGTRYKLDDEKPYVYKTEDYGKHWTLITKGITQDHFTRCLRADPKRRGHLYAGTEQGMYFSADDGRSWEVFQLNLPRVPITDLAIKEDDLIVATQGRSFWILDDLSFWTQLMDANLERQFLVFEPATAYRMSGSQQKRSLQEGQNPPNGVVFRYYLKNSMDSAQVQLKIYDTKDSLLREFNSKSGEKQDQCSAEKGINQFVWDMQVKGVDKVDDMILWNGNIGSYKVPPANYYAWVIHGKDSQKVNFVIRKDPNYTIDEQAYAKQFSLLNQIRNTFDSTQQTIRSIRQIRSQINALKDKLGEKYPADLDSLGKLIMKEMSGIEERLYQTKAKSGQDVLNYPIRLNDKLSGVFDAVNQHTEPSQSAREAYDDIAALIRKEFQHFQTLIRQEIASYNKLIREKGIDYLMLKNNK